VTKGQSFFGFNICPTITNPVHTVFVVIEDVKTTIAFGTAKISLAYYVGKKLAINKRSNKVP
jgi:hypothetical protein